MWSFLIDTCRAGIMIHVYTQILQYCTLNPTLISFNRLQARYVDLGKLFVLNQTLQDIILWNSQKCKCSAIESHKFSIKEWIEYRIFNANQNKKQWTFITFLLSCRKLFLSEKISDICYVYVYFLLFCLQFFIISWKKIHWYKDQIIT